MLALIAPFALAGQDYGTPPAVLPTKAVKTLVASLDAARVHKTHAWRDTPPEAGLAVLAGAPLACCGRPNRYRLRLVNGGPAPTEIALEVRGALRAAGEERRFQASAVHVLGPLSVLELACETDWVTRFALGGSRPWTGGGIVRPARGRCELVAIARVAGRATVARVEQAVGA